MQTFGKVECGLETSVEQCVMLSIFSCVGACVYARCDCGPSFLSDMKRMGLEVRHLTSRDSVFGLIQR